ncbi:hypothetical protein AXX17_ATUG00600 [Arabidopsis thaliana]|uniref:Uncharacterized protein n=1 Tax=Arabidopsis thaliana TaxID=3702 RepID=A0A178U861_ARATH|nr:hypothetical protein AXX17_ATUG00600 [Arabidopsis thaliana]
MTHGESIVRNLRGSVFRVIYPHKVFDELTVRQKSRNNSPNMSYAMFEEALQEM